MEALDWANANANSSTVSQNSPTALARDVVLQLTALKMATEYLQSPPSLSNGRCVMINLESLEPVANMTTTMARYVDDALAEFLNGLALSQAEAEDTVVFVTSDGGNVQPGMTIGQWAHAHVPLLWMLLPTSSISSNPELRDVVYDNGAAVVSGHNLYATLKHIALGSEACSHSRVAHQLVALLTDGT